MKPYNLRLLVAFWAILLFLAPRGALAQPSASDRAAAEALFNQALELLDQGKAADACPKLAESQKLDPGVGTLLYLADCYKQTGKTASAWGTFREAAYAASAAGQKDREETATKEAAALEGILSKLTVSVERPDIPGLRVMRDGQEVGRALWETPVPVDPGRVVVIAEAPGMISWKGEGEVPAGGGSTTIRVPMLATAPTPPPPVAPPPAAVAATAAAGPAPKPEASSSGGVQRGIGYLTIGLGAVGLVSGGVMGLVAKGKYEDSQSECRQSDDTTLCSPEGVEQGESAQSLATAATVVTVVGGVFFVGGIVVAMTASRSSSGSAAPVTLVARAGVGGGQLSLEGSW